MSLPLLHAGRTNPGLSAALDLRFALDKSLTAYRGPTPSFSRASTGSYFDGSGVLRYAALNTTLYSEDFSNAYWTKSNGTISTNQAISPDGKNTADLLYPSSTGAARGIYAGSPSATTISVYAKSSGKNWIALTDFSAATSAWFNLSNGTVGTVGAGYTAAIQNAGNGWYRCSLTKTTGFSYFQIYGTDSDNTLTATVNGTDGVFIWGAQGELSSTVGTYCPTTSSANSAPRFDHTFNGTSWVSRGLLVEEQRTNSFYYSESASNLGMINASVTSNAYTAPDGTQTADAIIPDTGSYNHGAYLYENGDGTNWAVSCFAKASGYRYLSITVGSAAALFDLTDGVYTGTSSGSPLGYGITNAGNGWHRIWVASATTNGSPSEIRFQISNSSSAISPTFSGNNVDGIQIWGMQREKSASFPTSYIKNTGSGSTTRSADVCQITGGDFSGFWNGTEGTLVAEYDRLASVDANFSSGYPRIATAVKTSDTSRAVTLFASQSPAGEAFFVQDGTVQAWFSAGSIASANAPTKLSAAYKANDFAASLNGAAVATDASGTIPSGIDRMDIGNEYGVTRFHNGHIARLRYFNKRLPNATLQLLSEPDPTLNLQFALNKTLTPVAGPAPSFSRASTGTYFNASGVLTSASINTPRFDHVYSGGQWVSRGLLVEEQRTNSLSNSEDFTVWAKSGNGQINSNVATAPDGTTTADEIQVNSGAAGAYEIYRAFTYSSVPYSISIFVKYVNNRWVSFGTNSPYHNKCVFFDILNGVVGTASPNHSGEIVNCGNGWYRLIVKFVGNTGTANYIDFTLADGNGVNSCTTGAKVLVWGAQIEVGSFPTSYIGTTSSSVTRSADVCQITGTSFNWMWNQGEGSFVAEYDRLFSASSISNASTVFQAFIDGNNNDRYALFHNSSGTVGERFNVTVGNVEYANLDSGVSVSQPVGRASSAYKLNDFALTVNGGSIVSDTSGLVVSNADKLNIGRMYSTNWLNGHIAKLIYYPARLTNTKLQQLST